jgi:hypothetical protein
MVAGDAHQNGKHDHVNEALGELAVVHRAYAGDYPQNRS